MARPQTVTFLDREGREEHLLSQGGESLYSLLTRHDIPPTSVITLCDKMPVADSTAVEPGHEYQVQLIEGYDIQTIRGIFRESAAARAHHPSSCFQQRHLSFTPTGAIQVKSDGISLADLATEIEDRVIETLTHFRLVSNGEKLVVGLSGGVDSSSLLLILNAASKSMGFEVHAVTFEDFDSRSAPTFRHAIELSESLGIGHHLVPATVVEETFRLNKPIHAILQELMDTPSAHLVMYIDHHTTRRALEVYAEKNKIGSIALGLHTTDLIAGLFNGLMTGYFVGDIPKRRVGDVTYIYPLAFVSKRELHLYHLHKTGALAKHSKPNRWEMFPKDRNYYYYLADKMQCLWPGVEDMLFTAHSWRVKKEPAPRCERCINCGSTMFAQSDAQYDKNLCDACLTFKAYGYLTADPV